MCGSDTSVWARIRLGAIDKRPRGRYRNLGLIKLKAQVMSQAQSDIAPRHLRADTYHALAGSVALILVTATSISMLWAQGEIKPGPPPPGPSHSATEILQSAINALTPVSLVEYTVRAIPANPSSAGEVLFAGRTVVLAAIGLPFRYRARFQSDSTPAIELAVSDGQTVRISAEGDLREYPTRTMEDRASANALPTLFAFDPNTYRKALANQSALYAGQDDIEGDLCYVVALPKLVAEEAGSDTSYYWISARTGLPRSTQTYRIFHGKTFLTYRWIISDIRVNPTIAPDAFTYHPTPADSMAPSTKAEPSKPTGASATEEGVAASLVGKQIPDLEVRDTEYKPLSLAQIAKGKATILTLWATWCAPCVEEFPAFQMVADRHRDDLQIVALAMDDSRLNVLNFIGKHPEYKFIFLTDPHLESGNSAIARFFVGKGVPRNAFIDPKGRIMEYRLGPYEVKSDAFSEKVDKWMAQLKTAE